MLHTPLSQLGRQLASGRRSCPPPHCHVRVGSARLPRSSCMAALRLRKTRGFAPSSPDAVFRASPAAHPCASIWDSGMSERRRSRFFFVASCRAASGESPRTLMRPHSSASVVEMPSRSSRRSTATGSCRSPPCMASGPGVYVKGGLHHTTCVRGEAQRRTSALKKSSIRGGQTLLPAIVATTCLVRRLWRNCSQRLCHLYRSTWLRVFGGKML
mmetsp:Transcript_106402/g.301281  ORF Transcript_106402/g.301281 Transcript_106402/m.301281 type:complete len:214 (-) Transcript_106402:1209-1850(-)